MKLNNGQKKTLSNIFRDLAKLTVAALVLGQFVPGHSFSGIVFLGGISTAVFMGIIVFLSLYRLGAIGSSVNSLLTDKFPKVVISNEIISVYNSVK